MMSIYIKNIKMPKSCWDCFACHDGWCIINQKIEGHRTVTHSCPLVEVPPHGRLIDADAILGKINAIISAHPDEADLYEQDAVIVRDWLRSEPTVIEREET